jgi:hypothetical protein
MPSSSGNGRPQTLGLRQNLFDQMHLIEVTDLPFVTLLSPLSVAVVRQRTHNDAPSPMVGETSDV